MNLNDYIAVRDNFGRECPSQVTETTIVPNPPTAGGSVRVWYASAAGSIPGEGLYNLHWGINGGATGGGAWENVTSTPMTSAGQGDMWYADITLPSDATSLNFVFNNGGDGWDNNSDQNWNFAVLPADAGNPEISLSPTTINLVADQGEDLDPQMVTITNTGTGILSYTAAIINPAKGVASKNEQPGTGSRKTITIDGTNTGGEWTEAELVALTPALDHANVVNGAWSTHETQFDYTALYAAWDDDNLYVGIQIVDVIDIVDPANAGSSQGTAPIQMNLPQFIAINTGPGGYGVSDPVSDMWEKAHGFAGDDQVNYQVYFASNFWQGPFVCEYIDGWDPDANAFGPVGQIYQPHPGLAGASAKADAGAPIIGPDGRDFRADGHDTSRNSFFEVQIPLELIGNPDLDNGSIGIFVGHGEGFSGVDTIPVDPAATDLPGVSESNSPLEWEDIDIYTTSFARVGLGDAPITSNWVSVSPSSGSIGEGASADANLQFTTAGLEPGTYTRQLRVEGNAANSPAFVDINLTVTGEIADPRIQLNKLTVSATVSVDGSPVTDTFTVRNSGGGNLEYTVGKVDTGDGTGWFEVSPTTGSSTGSANTVTVTFDPTELEIGSYTADIDIFGNGSNSPQTIIVNFTVQSAVPSTTTVQPNPPIAGQQARVWYASASGAISGAAQYNLHWGINGGATGGGDWEAVTSSPMTSADQGGMWYVDILIPGDATSLNFVLNNGGDGWDNNSGQNWNFPVNLSSDPVITVNQTTVTGTTPEGSNPAPSTFTVRNGGAGNLVYSLSLVDTGDGTDWLSVSPMSGTSTGNSNTHTITWNGDTLAPGVYMAGVEIDGDASNAPVVVTARLTVSSESQTLSPITIGPGPSLGVNTEGEEFFEEFQDWHYSDLRALDLDDAVELNDGYDMSRDLVAFYSRFENDNLFLRVDLLELGFAGENGFVDVYVLIDTGSGGTTSLPNSLPGSTPAPWNLAVATYDAVNQEVIFANGDRDASAHLGSYWRSDLDAVEFGTTQQALLDAGWDGSSTVDFMVFTAKDMTDSVTDTMGFEIPISSEGTTGRAKFATIAHGNQSFNRGDSMRDRLYISAANTGVGAPSGFQLTLDTHSIFQVPLNIHMSATLIAAIQWIQDDNPSRDGRSFLDRVGSFIDGDQSVDPGMKIGGVFAEHIMPYFVGEVNANSIELFDDLTRDLWGIDGNDMRIMHTPERVINALASDRDTFDDIRDSPYVATYLDEVAHIRDWLYPDDPWTGIGGEYGVPRQHKIHLLNGVYTFLINDQEDQYKFWPQDDGANMNWRLNLLWKALDTDQEQLTLIFDDWEALAGYSFGSGYNDNALQYNQVIRWVANKPWIEVVTLGEILDRATDPTHPQYSDNWVIDQGDIGDQPMMTYDWLQHATGDSYDNWYYGSEFEESFFDAVPVISGNAIDGTPIPSGKNFGALGVPGTIVHDTWEAVLAAPDNNLRRLAEMAYQAMIYETAWHDTANTDYTRDPATNYTTWLYPDTTYDRIAGWALRLHNHLRGVTITTTAAEWAESVRNGTRPAGVSVQAVDLDQDGEVEYVLSNERIWMAFEARSGRCVQAYYYDPSLLDAISFLGTSPINNPSGQGEEELTEMASRCSGFKEMNDGVYADVIYSVQQGADSLTFTSPNGLVVKTISLSPGSTTVTANYTNDIGQDLYTRMGVSVNNLDLFTWGRNFTSSYSATTFTQTNNTRGSVTIQAGSGAQINQIGEFERFVIPLTEQMELRLSPGSSSFTITVPN
ncbi:MAG: hypothetical protein JJU11_09425 [Candidatus Sumerlaeia bacterium]|nr:hypothetical protein [Candidatus Sumerlaeia bacterium]